MHFAAKLAEIPIWGKKIVSVSGQEILLVNTKGEIYACETECPHQGAPLSGALLKEPGQIICARHGWHFDLKTGACRENAQYTLRVFPIRVEGEDVLVDLAG